MVAVAGQWPVTEKQGSMQHPPPGSPACPDYAEESLQISGGCPGTYSILNLNVSGFGVNTYYILV